MLSAMFSGRYNVVKDGDGSYFIDRDGTHFRYILNYLRDGNTYLPTDEQQADELYEEVCFYGLEDLMAKLEQNRASANRRITYLKLLEMVNGAPRPL